MHVFSFCPTCLSLGYCRKRISKVVTDNEINNVEFVRDVRSFAFGLGVHPSAWPDFIMDLYGSFPGRIVDSSNREVLLETDEMLDDPALVGWFKDWACTPPSRTGALRVRKEARERVRIIASILRAQHPGPAQFWGLGTKAANDNR